MPRVVQRSQFSEGLPFNVAASLCGPAAAIAFVNANGGRLPTLSEAKALAERVGWTEAGGMNGFANQARLLQTMKQAGYDVPEYEVADRPDAAKVAATVRQGRPVTISSGLHYWTASDYDPDTGKFYVGASGTDVRGGKEWHTLEEMDAISRGRTGTGLNGAIYMGAPAAPQQDRQRFLEANGAPPDTNAVGGVPSSAPARVGPSRDDWATDPAEVQARLQREEARQREAEDEEQAMRLATSMPGAEPVRQPQRRTSYTLPPLDLEPLEMPTLTQPRYRMPTLGGM